MPEIQENRDSKKPHQHSSVCDEVNRRIYAFIDGRLDIADLKELQEHIKQCVSCATLVQFEQKLIQIIRKKGGYTHAEVPESLKEKIKKVFDLQDNHKQ